MARRRKKFPKEERAHGAQSPGIVEDDEELERKLPLEGERPSVLRIPRPRFPAGNSSGPRRKARHRRTGVDMRRVESQAGEERGA